MKKKDNLQRILLVDANLNGAQRGLWSMAYSVLNKNGQIGSVIDIRQLDKEEALKNFDPHVLIVGEVSDETTPEKVRDSIEARMNVGKTLLFSSIANNLGFSKEWDYVQEFNPFSPVGFSQVVRIIDDFLQEV